jgi:hypothetical protein
MNMYGLKNFQVILAKTFSLICKFITLPMLKSIITLFIFTGICHSLVAQRLVCDFKLPLADHPINNCPYSHITFLDIRSDTSSLGFIQQGAFNRKAMVVPSIALSRQVSNVLDSITDNNAANGEILFQVSRLAFSELTRSTSEKGFFYFRADMFARNNKNQYSHVNTIDTLITVKRMDVTHELLREGSHAIANFILTSLKHKPLDSISYSLNDVIHLDSIEKIKIPVFNTSAFSDGIYFTYNSFRIQKSDAQVFAKSDEDGIYDVKYKNKKGRFVWPKYKKIYALVFEGRPYIQVEGELYPLIKEGNNLNFTAPVTLGGDYQHIGAEMLFGIAGAIIADNVTESQTLSQMKLDHRNGSFIFIKKVAKTDQ